MSFNNPFRNLRGKSDVSVALAHIEQEGSELIQRLTQREPAKLISLRTRTTPRQVYNWRQGECQPRWMHFIALAQEYPELRAAVARWLGLADKSDPKAQELIEQIRRMVEAQPEEGDRG